MRTFSIPFFGATALTAWLIAFPVAAAEPVRVVASIKPVHSLVAMVLNGIAEPYLIVNGASSPHGHAMRPSDAKALASADAVFWIGPELETSLTKPLQTLPASARVVALMNDDHGEHGHDKENEHEKKNSHGHDHGGTDPHTWLSPQNAVDMLEHIAEAMTEVIPAQAKRIKSNRDRSIQQLIEVDAEVRRLVAPMQNDYLVVLHEAYGHFTGHYGLKDFIALSVTPEHKPTPGNVRDVRQKITEFGVRCVFAEPQFPDTFVRVLIEGTSARPGVIDPLGAQLMPGPDLYPQLLRLMGFAIRGCYEETS
ncbi:MAG: zinc ABC transporter substrate-binding protein [Rhodospirillales bacterium]